MIEIRDFEEGPEELAAFINRVWRHTYEGRMPTPLWSPEYLRRDLFPEGGARDFLIAAYDGPKLVGVHPAKRLKVRLHGDVIDATWASFLSVDPEYRRRGAALRLQAEYFGRHRERGVPVNFGYLYMRSVRFMGSEFWLRQPAGMRIVSRLGMWVRPLDHAAVARFSLYRFEAWGSRALRPIQRVPRAPTGTPEVRSYRPSDLGRCCELLNAEGDRADLAYVWDRENLANQLDFPSLSRTVVLERQGNLEGLLNYTLLEVLGKCPMRIGVIENIAFGRLSSRDRRRLIGAGLVQMAGEGAQAVTMVRGSWRGWRELLAAGFFPSPPEYYYVGMTTQDGVPLGGVRRLNVLWR